MSTASRSTRSVGRKIKALREARRLSMRELANRSGTSASLISKIESGEVSPTVLSLQKILDGMSIELYEFFLDDHDDLAHKIVFRKSEMPLSEDDERVWRLAFPKRPEMKAQLSMEEYLPHSKAAEKIRRAHDTFGIVISGELALDVEGTGKLTLNEGDAFYLKAGMAHAPGNETDQVARLVSVDLRV